MLRLPAAYARDTIQTRLELPRLVDAACKTHPDWVMRQCKRQAEQILAASAA